MKLSLSLRAAGTSLLLVVTLSVKAAPGISYTTPGATYIENFDSLPTDAPNNANIQTVYIDGWVDDSATVANTNVSLPGWYLYHPLAPITGTPPENGSNDHQRLRFGSGANTGSFWAFGSNGADPEKALGCIGSNTVADPNTNMYIALRLVNKTGVTLGSFTVTYNGEQWRDGASPTGETLSFAYSLTALPADWNTTATFTEVPALNFTSPSASLTGTSGNAVAGNTTGLIQDISATISNISWAPNIELWLRWADPQLPSLADDGLAIDNFNFTAAAAVTIPDPGLKFGRNGSGQLQLEWQGRAGYSYQVQHSTDLQTWTADVPPAPESNGPMTYVIPSGLLSTGRHYFRLKRAILP